MQPTISQLKDIFEHKIKILKRLLTYVKPVRQFAEDMGLVWEEGSEELILEHHFFRKDEGLLPIIRELIDLNKLILSYDEPRYLGELASRHYKSMIEDINNEQKFLAIFAQSLEEITEHKGFNEYWKESFEHYQHLVDLLRGDLTSLKRVYETTAKTASNWIINLIAIGDFDNAIIFLNENSTAKSLGEEGESFFRRLIAAIKAGNIEEIDKISEEGKDILDIDEYLLLKRVLIARIKPAIRAGQQPAMEEASQVAKALAEKAEALGILSEEARKAGADDVLAALEAGERRVDGALEEVQTEVPEVVKTAGIRRRKKKVLKRLRQSLRVRRKLSWRFVKRRSVSALNEADFLIKRATAELRARRARNIQKKFAEEREKLEILARKLLGLERQRVEQKPTGLTMLGTPPEAEQPRGPTIFDVGEEKQTKPGAPRHEDIKIEIIKALVIDRYLELEAKIENLDIRLSDFSYQWFELKKDEPTFIDIRRSANSNIIKSINEISISRLGHGRHEIGISVEITFPNQEPTYINSELVTINI